MYEATILIAGFIAGFIVGIALLIALMNIAANEIVSEKDSGPESGRDPEHPAKSPDIQETKSPWTWNPSTFGRKG